MKKENIFMKIWRVIYPVGIYFLISNLISIVFLMIYAMIIMSKSMSNGETLDAVALQTELMTSVYKYSMSLTALAAAIMIPIAYLLFRSDKKKENVKFEKFNIFSFGFVIVLAAMACLGGNQLLSISKLDVIFPGFNDIQEALYGGSLVMEVLAAVILAPIVEELLFRGLVFKRLNGYMGKLPAMILSSLFFGIYHGNVVQGVYAFTIGMIFAFIYDRYKTLLAPILAHILANLVSVLSVETGIFNPLYASDMSFYISTVVEVVVCVGLIVLINKKVTRKEIIIEHENEDEYNAEVIQDENQ